MLDISLSLWPQVTYFEYVYALNSLKNVAVEREISILKRQQDEHIYLRSFLVE